MAEPDLIALFIRPLEVLGSPYMITGGVASVIYGDPRFTRDIDIVLHLRETDIEAFGEAFGAPDYYVPPLEVLAEEVVRRPYGHFNVIHMDTALRADVYLMGEDPLHSWAFKRRVRMPLDQGAIWVAPIEYVLVRKLQYYRGSGSDRHLRDAAMMLAVSGERIGEEELQSWIGRLGLEPEWRLAKGFGG